MTWFLVAILAAAFIALAAYTLKIRKGKSVSDAYVAIQLRILLKHFGAARTAQYLVDTLETTSGTGSTLLGLYLAAGLPLEHSADIVHLLTKDGPRYLEGYRKNGAETRTIVIDALAVKLKILEDKFRDEDNDYSEPLKSASHNWGSSPTS